MTLRRAGRLLSRVLLRKARLKLPPLPPPQAASPSLPHSWSKASSPRLQGATPLYLVPLGRGWQGRAGSQRAGVTTHSPLLWPGPVKGLGHSLAASPMDPITLHVGPWVHNTSPQFPRSVDYYGCSCQERLEGGCDALLPTPQLRAAPASFGLAPSTPSEIPARALQWSQGPGVMGTEARISQQPDQKTTIRGWDIQGAVLHTSPSMLPSASEPPDFIPCLQELPSTGLTQPSCFLPSSRLPQSAATLPPQGTDICPPSQLPFPLHSSFISRLECRTSLFQEPLQDGPRDPHSPQRPLWV